MIYGTKTIDKRKLIRLEQKKGLFYVNGLEDKVDVKILSVPFSFEDSNQISAENHVSMGKINIGNGGIKIPENGNAYFVIRDLRAEKTKPYGSGSIQTFLGIYCQIDENIYQTALKIDQKKNSFKR
ncbi:MAG TPA: hypothetical protein P5277_03535 [Candidatus Paceibacterota bacterium]|nr:hypothetical protein [Candidatus Paceibacterota bacterium]